MNIQKTRNVFLLTGLMAAAGFMTSAQAQDNSAAAPAAQAAPAQAAPTVDAAAVDAALRKRLQAVVAGMDGKTKLAANNFTEQFLQSSPIATVQGALDSLRTNLGTCKPIGRMQSENPVATSVLLDCNKGFLPLEFAVEPQSPYRISGILLRPAYWK